MAFWRPLSMDSWNPLSWSFWTLNNLIGSPISILRLQLKDQLEQDLPDILKDPLTSEELTDIVVTPYGHCFNKESLTKHWTFQIEQGKSIENYTCPLTKQKLNETLLIRGKHLLDLKKILNDIDCSRKYILLQIKKMKLGNKDHIKKSISEYHNNVEKTADKFANILNEIKEMALIKERLKLDSTKSSHLEFWSKSHSPLEKKLNSFTEVKDTDNKNHKIPQSIYNLMFTTAHREFDTKDMMLEAIKTQFKNERGGLFAMPTLSRHEKLLLNENLKSVDFRKSTLTS